MNLTAKASQHVDPFGLGFVGEYQGEGIGRGKRVYKDGAV